jgi:hypothetical protein
MKKIIEVQCSDGTDSNCHGSKEFAVSDIEAEAYASGDATAENLDLDFVCNACGSDQSYDEDGSNVSAD